MEQWNGSIHTTMPDALKLMRSHASTGEARINSPPNANSVTPKTKKGDAASMLDELLRTR